MVGIIYKIVNKINGKRYIGQTTSSLHVRWLKHISNKDCTYLHNAIEKYGEESFERKILTKCDSMEEMNHREAYYIKLFNTLAPNGYNIRKGGNNSRISEETKRKISKSLKGRKKGSMPEETKKKISIAKKASKKPPNILSPESIEKIRIFHLGKPKSKGHCENISKSRQGMKLSREHKAAIGNGLKKKIICNETGKIYDSTKDAAIELGVVPSSIWGVLNGHWKTCKGLSFSYFKNEELILDNSSQ